MPTDLKLSVLDYYDVAPPADNAAGDVWSGLPCHGFLGTGPLTGIVITPACDLSNNKVETITYLPIVPVRAFFGTPAYLPELMRELSGQLEAANLKGLVECPSRFVPPRQADIDAARIVLDEASKSGGSAKASAAIERARAGVDLLDFVRQPALSSVPVSLWRTLLGEKNSGVTLERIVRNAYRTDLYFLPNDQQRRDWSGVPDHSLVLFRYAFSAPICVFERAASVSEMDWLAVLADLREIHPGIDAFGSVRPLKRLRLRPRFLSDLLTKYAAMHVRLGAPDFTPDTVDTFIATLLSNP
jgi:hypothetical protein